MFLHRTLAAVTALSLALGPALARSQEVRRAKIAVLDVNATGNLAKKEVEGLSALIASEVLAASGADVIAGADIRSLVGFEKQRQMLGCSDTGCLAEIGGALGADFIVGSEVSVVGSTYLLSLSLVDIKRARVVSRLTRTTKKDDDLVPISQDAVRELMLALPRPGAEPAAARPSAAPAAAVATSPSSQKKSALPAFLMIGLGGASLVGGGLALLGAAGKRQEFVDGTDGTPTLTLAAADELRKQGEGLRNLGYAALGAGVILGVVGVLLLPSGESTPKVAVSADPGGAAITAVLPLP